MDDFRTALSEELSELSAPPLAGLIEAATRDGRRVRRRRTVAAAVGSVTALAAAVALLGGPVGPLRQPAAGPAVQSAAAEPPVGPPSPSASAHTVPTTSRALLAAVVQALPGTTWKGSDYAVSGPEQDVSAMLNVTEGTGTGVVRVTLLAGKDSGCTQGGARFCTFDSRGQLTSVDYLTAPCPQTVVVTVRRADATRAQVLFGNCRIGENAYYFPPGANALTAQQAVELAGGPALSLHSDSRTVEAAEQQYRRAAPLR
ncbi:hypothetical protein [Kitasatospora terrestris]|uniref:Tat pathway signal sequence domain protein n=1 Tax=Kitasatospora terrestris TaxID=258051 RepID=A0ABP9DLU4_9ACTN